MENKQMEIRWININCTNNRIIWDIKTADEDDVINTIMDLLMYEWAAFGKDGDKIEIVEVK